MDKIVNSTHSSKQEETMIKVYILGHQRILPTIPKKPLFIAAFTEYPRKCPIWLLGIPGNPDRRNFCNNETPIFPTRLRNGCVHNVIRTRLLVQEFRPYVL